MSRTRIRTALPQLSLVLAGLAGFLLIAYVVLKLAPDWFAETDGLDAQGKGDARQGVRTASLALLAGAIAVVGAIYTARTFALNRAGQLTDRFTKAIEQLGHKEVDVRLGGIYALERIARDSKEDHPQVVEVLTAYVRQHAPRRDAPPSGNDPPEFPSTDVQAALTVLGRRVLDQDDPSRVPALDLSETHLQFAGLRKAQLMKANLVGAVLTNARLSRADLSQAWVAGSDLRYAKLGLAVLAHTDLTAADLSGADLEGANLVSAQLTGADLRGASLEGADLSLADLGSADLRGTRFVSADSDSKSAAGLETANLHAAVYDSDTIWPKDFDPQDAGALRGSLAE